MKKLFLLSVAVMAFLSFSPSVQAENTTGNVYADAYQSDTVIVVRLAWFENDSLNFIQPFISWDTTYKHLGDTGSYSNIDLSSWGVKYYSREGLVEFLIPAKKSCKEFYFRISFIDGMSQKRNNISRMVVTEGSSAPVMHHSTIVPNFSSVMVGVTIENTCNSLWIHAEIFLKSSVKVATVSAGGYDNYVSFSVYDLLPNEEYYVDMTIHNGYGSVSFIQSFRTMSNLPPVVESLRSTVLSPRIAEVTSHVDTKNTHSTEVRIEYGEQIGLENLGDWFLYTGVGNYNFQMENLKPNTVYFWRPVARNQFGQDEGQTKMFKTNEFATAVTEITSDDLLQVSSCPAGIRIYPEKDAIVEIYSIAGQKVLTTNLRGGEAHIFSSLTPGMYIVKSLIEGYTVTKKALVN
ncbi:MAG: T9SS type A sorting domain-containing protein [Candidatus Pacebacteria bacterium]|nr:T9SS type A sorting domain-containing protein [Candidatus Paceibacterota bacterium]